MGIYMMCKGMSKLRCDVTKNIEDMINDGGFSSLDCSSPVT
jgi:hypothetical protein